MMRSLKVVMLSSALLLSPAAFAADLLVNTFLQSRPFKGVELELNGKLVGETGALGEAKATLDAGRHELRLLKNGIPLADYAFDLAAGENAELSITFTNFDTAPDFALETYAEGEGADANATGTIGGDVMTADGQPIAGATVGVAEVASTTLTNENGVFELVLPRGAYTLQISHPDYQPIERAGFRVVANVGLAASIKLYPVSDGSSTAVTASADEEVVVLGTYKPTENTADLEKFSVAITDAISIDELLRFGDGDVAASLKRLVGVSITGGRYAVVRGLDGRYISATLNGNLMPSTDPFRRDVQLDLFPSDILSGIEVQKTFSADLPGDTTGGNIKIKTRGIPDGYVNSLSVSLGFVTGVTGDDILSYEGGDTDFLGIDDGTREIPGALKAVTNGVQLDATPAENAALAVQLPNIWNVQMESAGPNFDIGYALGNVFERSSGVIGLYAAGAYGQSAGARQDAFIDDERSVGSYEKSSLNRTLNGYFVAGYEANSGWSLLSRTMVLRDTEDEVTTFDGFDISLDFNVRETSLEWVERQFLAQQFEGEHLIFGGAHTLNWRAGVSQTDRYSPDRRSYRYEEGRFTFSSLERSYSDLTEDGLDLGVDYTIPFTVNATVGGNIKGGILANSRERDVELIRIGLAAPASEVGFDQDLESILAPENFENGNLRLAPRSDFTDSYTAEQEAIAGYLTVEANIGERWTTVVGVRQDNFSLDLAYPNAIISPNSGYDSDELLPSLALIYRPNEAWQLRAGYSATVSRPNVTEVSESRFYDEDDRLFTGCPTCGPSNIDNFDLRAEYYFGASDSVSVAVFTKEIDDPLEVALSLSPSILTFRSGETATVSGVEIDVNKTIVLSDDLGLSIGGNLAFIDSEVTLSPQGQALEGAEKRELQGQSPFLFNTQIGLDHYPTRQKLTLLANYFDDRIDRVGRGDFPSTFEAGRISLNANYEKAFGERSKVKVRAKNLLDESTEYTQGGRVVESYKDGVEFSLGYSVDF